MGLYQRQKEYFEKAYSTGEHGWPTVGPTPFVLRALPRIKAAAAPGRGRILDLGCGEGRHALACARAGFDAVGLDYQPRAIRKARAFARKLKIRRGVRFMVGDAFRLPFPPDRFDGIIDYGCLHHVKIGDTRRYFDSVLPRLKPGGYFILSCFSTRFKHHPGEKRRRNWLVHRGHYDRFFRKRDFKTLFGKQFDILKLEEKGDGLYVFWHVLMRKR
ncbi:MAG: class I SAM-dependent methyltransferase [Nitrospirae bacterium]|nr:class I SAM-dependent methyltransferase [Nitrospirota bacterium]